MRKNSYAYKVERPLDNGCREMICTLLEKELRLAKKRDQIKRELLKRDDFVKSRVFCELTKGKADIEIDALVYFLEKNKFNAKREDWESILRRIDHSGD